MKYSIIFLLSLLGIISYAAEQSSLTPAQQVPTISASKAQTPEIPLPSLGSCDEYTDYFIYQCMPFKCRLQIGNQEIYRQMETIGYQDNKCVHNIKFLMLNKAYPPAESYIYCNLSETGRLEMANLFTRYKKGDLKVYTKPTLSPLLKQECQVTKYKKP